MSWLRWLWLLPLPAAIWATQEQIDARHRPRQHERLLVRSGETLRKLWPGFELLIADIYWLRSVQYYGSQKLLGQDARYTLLEPLIDITTTLDPRFLVAYRYGAIFLAEHPPNGAGRPEAAVALLERGVEKNPETWELRWDLGIVHYLFRRDPAEASPILLEAAKLPGAPFWLETMAGRTALAAGRRETSRAIWQRLFELNEGGIRENARLNLQALDAVDVVDELQDRVARFQEREGRPPMRLGEISRRGGRPLPVVDPTGVSFRYNPETGRVSVSDESALWWVLPEEERE